MGRLMPYDDPEALEETLNTLKVLIRRGMPYPTRPDIEDSPWIRTIWPNEWYL